jgi:hypothetical protein
MIVQLKTLQVAPDHKPVADAISNMATLITPQIDQTRKQIAQLATSPSVQAALASTTAGVSTGVSLAAPVVAEFAMSALESRVYDATTPATIEGASMRQAVRDYTRQELLLRTEGITVEPSQDAADVWAADPELASKTAQGLEEPHVSAPHVGSILEHAFGPKINRFREQSRIAAELNRPILGNSLRPVKA